MQKNSTVIRTESWPMGAYSHTKSMQNLKHELRKLRTKTASLAKRLEMMTVTGVSNQAAATLPAFFNLGDIISRLAGGFDTTISRMTPSPWQESQYLYPASGWDPCLVFDISVSFLVRVAAQAIPLSVLRTTLESEDRECQVEWDRPTTVVGWILFLAPTKGLIQFVE